MLSLNRDNLQEINLTKTEEVTLEAFFESHKRLFGTYPTITFSDGFFRVRGFDGGMNIKRIKELVKQFKRRITNKEAE